MELKGQLFKFSSPFPTLILFYSSLFGFIWSHLGKTSGTCAQAHEKELLECGTQLSVQPPASSEGLPSRDQVGR